MKPLRYFFFSLIVAAAMTGCSSTPIATGATKPVPKERITGQLDNTQSEHVLIKRSDTFYGGACAHRVHANGKALAELRPGERVEFTLPEGRHILGIDVPGICPGRMRELVVHLKGGEQRIFLVDVSPISGELIFQETAY